MNPSPARDRSRRDQEAHKGREDDEEGGEEEVGDEGALPALQGHPEAGYRVAAPTVLDGQLIGVGEQLVHNLVGQLVLDGGLGVEIDVDGGRHVLDHGVPFWESKKRYFVYL